MPSAYIAPYSSAKRDKAVARVLARYPSIIVGSSGYFRAVAYQMKKGQP